MKTLIMIAWRNLWRHRRRSIIVMSSIGLGVFAMIIFMSYFNGIFDQMLVNTISTSLGHVAIHEKGFQDNMKIDYHFLSNKDMEDKIIKNPMVKSFAPRVKAQAMVRSAEAARGVLVYGIDPGQEKTISKISDYTLKENGSSFLDSASDPSILISKTMAKKLDLVPGDKLVLMIQDKTNEIVGIGMTVKGIYQTPIETFDRFVVYTGIKQMQDITGIKNNISEINILLNDIEDVDLVKKSLISEIDNTELEILSWKDMAPNLVSTIKLFDTAMYIFFAIVFVTIIFSIANTLVMAIMERFHEIGVMKSIGTKPSWIFSMVLFEAINLGIAGLVVGIGAGLIVISILSRTGVDFSYFVEAMRMWGTGSILYPSITLTNLVLSCIIVITTTIIAALYPAVKASKIKPLEALNYV